MRRYMPLYSKQICLFDIKCDFKWGITIYQSVGKDSNLNSTRECGEL